MIKFDHKISSRRPWDDENTETVVTFNVPDPITKSNFFDSVSDLHYYFDEMVAVRYEINTRRINYKMVLMPCPITGYLLFSPVEESDSWTFDTEEVNRAYQNYLFEERFLR